MYVDTSIWVLPCNDTLVDVSFNIDMGIGINIGVSIDNNW